MKTYRVEYTMYYSGEVMEMDVLARNKEEAYDKAVYTMIPDAEEDFPFSAWVASVTYSNGNYKRFNTFEGKPY